MQHNQPEEWEIEFEVRQKKIWQLPEGTMLQRQTIQFIKEYVEKTLKNQKQSLLSTLKSEVEGLLISEEELPEEYRMKGFLEAHQKTAVKGSNIAIKKVINLIEKHQNGG